MQFSYMVDLRHSLHTHVYMHACMQSLDDVQRSLDMLSTSCGNITSALSATKSSSSALLGETERLQRELEGVERRQELVNQFLEQYQLKPEEVGVHDDAPLCLQLLFDCKALCLCSSCGV